MDDDDDGDDDDDDGDDDDDDGDDDNESMITHNWTATDHTYVHDAHMHTHERPYPDLVNIAHTRSLWLFGVLFHFEGNGNTQETCIFLALLCDTKDLKIFDGIVPFITIVLLR